MTETILLTRPRAASERWALRLTQRGFACVVEPLLTIKPTDSSRPDGDFQAVMMTSAHAAEIAGGLKDKIADLLSLPCFCVGAATGEAARGVGFANIYCGDSDSAALAHRAAAMLGEKTKPLLHIAGEDVCGDAQNILAEKGFVLTRWPVYRAAAAADFTPSTRALFARGDIAALPVFSPRTARILVSIIEKNRLTQACSTINAVGLSQAVADVLQIVPWRRLRVAASPDDDQIFACL
ncbi:MAG: uroporphyrinogen-III synthase [Alphaproteobacteria bacterium]|nr:uroporphyrinogen-III synthase [Alphaproteobacteria bacterium]